MTPEQKMQKIVEAAGECWHKGSQPISRCNCLKCGESLNIPSTKPWNPSPADLNELFRLAEKLDIEVVLSFKPANLPDWGIAVVQLPETLGETMADTPAEALLNALYEALKDKEVADDG